MACSCESCCTVPATISITLANLTVCSNCIVEGSESYKWDQAPNGTYTLNCCDGLDCYWVYEGTMGELPNGDPFTATVYENSP